MCSPHSPTSMTMNTDNEQKKVKDVKNSPKRQQKKMKKKKQQQPQKQKSQQKQQQKSQQKQQQQTPAKDEKQQKRKKSVKFNRRVVMHKGLRIEEYSDEERQNTWYSKKEMSEIKAETKITLSLMVKAGANFRTAVDRNGTYCTRGLEARLTATSRRKRKLRQKSITAVMVEQNDQQDLFGDKHYHPELIALLYTQHTLNSVQDAFDFGLLDQQDAFYFGLQDLQHQAAMNEKNGELCRKDSLQRQSSGRGCSFDAMKSLSPAAATMTAVSNSRQKSMMLRM